MPTTGQTLVPYEYIHNVSRLAISLKTIGAFSRKRLKSIPMAGDRRPTRPVAGSVYARANKMQHTRDNHSSLHWAIYRFIVHNSLGTRNQRSTIESRKTFDTHSHQCCVRIYAFFSRMFVPIDIRFHASVCVFFFIDFPVVRSTFERHKQSDDNW